MVIRTNQYQPQSVEMAEGQLSQKDHKQFTD
jgi:hypothetical protein